jgi:hypothetical protein
MRLALVLLCACGVTVKGGNARNELVDSGTGGGDDGAIDAAVAPPDAPRTCDGGDSHGTSGTSCFVYFTTAKNWADARTACQGIPGADLAIVTSKEQNDVIGSLIGTAPDPASTVFIGGTDAATEGTWLWVDNTQFWMGGPAGTAGNAFANFKSTQPNDGNGLFAEDCLVIRGDSTDLWFDRPCADEGATASPGLYGYICQYSL